MITTILNSTDTNSNHPQNRPTPLREHTTFQLWREIWLHLCATIRRLVEFDLSYMLITPVLRVDGLRPVNLVLWRQ